MINTTEAAGATPNPKIVVDCSAQKVPGTDGFGMPNLNWTPNVRIAYSGKKATVKVKTVGDETTITLSRNQTKSTSTWEGVSYSHTFNSYDFELGTHSVKFTIYDSKKRSASFTCTYTLSESDFPVALESSSGVTPGLTYLTNSKLPGCRYKGIYLAGNVYINNNGSYDFRVNKTSSYSNADLAVKTTRFPSACGEWNIVKSRSIADFTIYLSNNNYYSDFEIYTGN